MFLTYYGYYMIGHNMSLNNLKKTICTRYCTYIDTTYIHTYVRTPKGELRAYAHYISFY